ncbi:MAG: hypothetical protein WA862_01235 [Solirubrobacterales bacterium]
MESMRESWTDERLDDLNHKVGSGFDRIDADIRGLRVETRTEFGALRGETRSEFVALRAEMKAGFDRVDERFERIDERFEALHRLLVQSVVVLLAALVGLHFV